MSQVDEVFKRQLLFNVRDVNVKGRGYFPKYWQPKYEDWEKEGLVTFKDGYWLTEVGHKFLSAI